MIELKGGKLLGKGKEIGVCSWERDGNSNNLLIARPSSLFSKCISDTKLRKNLKHLLI